MATMVKEKRREKKKIKEKQTSKISSFQKLEDESTSILKEEQEIVQKRLEALSLENTDELVNDSESIKTDNIRYEISETVKSSEHIGNLVENDKIESFEDAVCEVDNSETIQQSDIPSAPIFEEETTEENTISSVYNIEEEVPMDKVKIKVQCMPIEEAVGLFGGKEISEVKSISEKEETIVETGPISGPEHPLVDLLLTFRSSLNALEQARASISQGFIQEEESRTALWKVEKQKIFLKQKCPQCAKIVYLSVNYEWATLQREKIPAARMRLESLVREVQDSYCHHQHSALLAYCQIEELVYETMQSAKAEIREALSLMLQALRLCDDTSEAYSKALQRWSILLSASLLHDKDLRQLIFLIHHLFRQNRSVRWAAQVIRLQATDLSGAAQVIGLLELMLTRPALETVVECTEELGEVWEEVGKSGEGSAVSDGQLRERDALALLKCLPLRQMIAKLALFSRSDISSMREDEWGDYSGGHGVLKAACGTRVLLNVLQRAMCAHTQYVRLHRSLQRVCACALHTLAALHQRSRAFYHENIYHKVVAELEAAFVAGLEIFSSGDMRRLPAALLSDDAAKDYCVGIMLALHDYSPHQVASLGAQLPALPCDVRVRVILQAAIDRADDGELARMVLEFLCQTAVKLKQSACKNLCCGAARESLPRLLEMHPYLHCTSLHVMADLNQADPVEPASVSHLAVHEWRPNTAEVLGVLEDWSLRCPQLIEHLLLQLNYRPHYGISLETQLAIGSWICEYVSKLNGETAEWAWLVMRRLNVHRTRWAAPLDAPPPHTEPCDLLSTVYALLSSAWGHSIPLICSVGARALCRVARARPQEAVHCLGALMRVMQHSPESVALTPEFTEVFSILLGAGPSLMERAFGRGGPTGAELLEQMLLKQLTDLQTPYCFGALNPWLRGLWAPTLPCAARALLDASLRVVKDWPALDATVSSMLQGENWKELLSDAVRNTAVAPLLCEAALRGAHAQCESVARMWPRLLDALAQQRTSGQRIHVDNALKVIGVSMSAEELVVYRVATAALVAPHHHPAHLTLWRLFFHLYLQRPPSNPDNTTAPVGPLFFSGIIKSRVLSQLKRRLQETITYHHTKSEELKPLLSTEQTQQITTCRANTRTSVTVDSNLFPSMSITDLTGQSSSSDTKSDTSDDDTGDVVTADAPEELAVESQEKAHLYYYHVAAEKLVRNYSRWLNEGDKVNSLPHHADIARFIPEQGLNAAWRSSLPSWCQTTSPSQTCAPSPSPRTHMQTAIHNLLKICDNSSTRPRIPQIKPLLGDQNNLGDPRAIFNLVDKYLREFETLAKDWSGDMKRISKLNEEVWGLVSALRVRRPLPSCTKKCANHCPPLTFHLQKEEWVISTGAQQGIEENRRSALAVLRRLARPRPNAARLAAALQTLARYVRSNETARRVAERAGQSADAVGDYGPALDAISSLVTYLAERWLCGDAGGCGQLVRSWGAGGTGRRALCSALVSPRHLSSTAFLQLYESLVTAPLPAHALFSYLSKFEISSWAERVDSALREKLLDVLIKAAQRRGKSNQPEDNVLLELMGVHIRAACRAEEVCGLILQSALATTRGALPVGLCAHVTHAASHVDALNYNELGNLLRTLGKYWWKPRTALSAESDAYAPYAAHTADLLQILQRAFVTATKALGHDVEKVSWFSWSALSEAWAPWVHAAHPWPLLPVTYADTNARDAHAHMLKRFVETLQLIMDDCPGSNEYIYRYVWEWAVHMYLTVSAPGAPQGCRVQLSALLTALEALAWTQAQWMHASCMPLVLQVSRSTDREITNWCCLTWRNIAAGTWLRGVPNEQLAPHLAALLSIFCSAQLQIHSQALDEATRLPWYRLPEPALDAAFEQFFVDHHNPAFPYHEIPQFRVLLAASQLLVVEGTARCDGVARSHRARSISQCVRAAATPSQLPHIRSHMLALLRTVSDLAPHIESSEGEIEELLSRAIVIMCLEPAAGAALPVWEQWVRDCGVRLILACASAVASLTALEYFVPLAEAVARALISHPDAKCGGWGLLRARWASCAWGGGAACAAAGARRSWHAAYALLPTGGVHIPLEALRSLAAHDLVASDDDPIIAVWVCVACRIVKQKMPTSTEGVPLDQELEEGLQSAKSLLCRWAAEPRRSLLQVVAMQQNSEAARIRLLCRLAQCILNPSAENARVYEASCGALLGSAHTEVTSWGKAPRPHYLPRLATRLYPAKDVYFKDELEAISVDT